MAESRDGSPCAMAAESMDKSLVPRWQKVWIRALCHGGRKYGWEPCATVAESESGSLVLRWQKVKSRSLYAMMAESMSRVPCVTVA